MLIEAYFILQDIKLLYYSYEQNENFKSLFDRKDLYVNNKKYLDFLYSELPVKFFEISIATCCKHFD